MNNRVASLPPLPLASTEAHLWEVFPDAVTDPELVGTYLQLLSPEERIQHQRFRFEKDRHQFVLTRALLRTTLSRYVAVNPRSWSFENNAFGKPVIAYPRGVSLTFNLSNTSGLIVCLVALDREVGVDVENMARSDQLAEIAQHFFSLSEAAALRTLPEETQRQRFFEYWTLKEAYIKARGMGLSLPLDQFSFHVEAGQPVRITVDSRLEDDPETWQFARFHPTPRHIMAVAIRRGAAQDLNIKRRQTVPLVF